MTAATPGQAAHRADGLSKGLSEESIRRNWEGAHFKYQQLWEDIAQAAIAITAVLPENVKQALIDAATEDGLRPCSYTLADVGRFLEAEAAAQDARPAPGESSALGLKHAVTSNRLGHALAALREIVGRTEGSGQGLAIAAHGIARNALDDDEAIRDNAALTREPKPAPELAGCGCPKTDGKIYHQRGTCTDPVAAKLDWYADAGRIAAAPAPELAAPVTVAGVPYSDYPSLVAAMQAEIDRERTARLHMAGERDEVRSDVARVRRAILASGKTHQWKIQQLLAIVGEIPAGEPEQPAPELADAVAKSDRYREALENVFAVLDRNILTYAERISYARTLIRTAREGK